MDRLNDLNWKKSSYSGNGGDCVEVGTGLPGRVAIRDTKHRKEGMHVVTTASFAALLDDIRAGKLSI